MTTVYRDAATCTYNSPPSGPVIIVDSHLQQLNHVEFVVVLSNVGLVQHTVIVPMYLSNILQFYYYLFHAQSITYKEI